MKTILSQLGQYKKDSVITPVFAALEVFMEVLIPYITALIIDQGLEQGDINKVYLYGGIMVVIALVSLLFGALSGKYSASASAGLAANLRESIYSCIQTFSFSNIDKFSTAGLITRMTTDVTNIQNAYQMVLRIAVRSPFMLVCSLAMCFAINARLSLVFVAAILFLGVALGLIMRMAMKIFDQVFKEYDNLNASVQENVSAIRVVKTFVREEYENKKFRKAADYLYQLSVKAESILAFNNPAMMLAIYFCMIGVAWFGAKHIVMGNMTTGELTSLFSYIMSIMMSLMMLSMVFVMITMSYASMRRISEVLTENADLHNPKDPLHKVKDGSIEFQNVNFAYKGESEEETLKGINIRIESGETIGIIGGTGSGKTSLVSLISRLYDVKDGCVCVGGEDVRAYDMEALRDQVSVVLQKNVLFSGTILDNLRWGNENASEEECKKVCRAASADEFIERFPKKYESYVERGGANLSGGQRQRLCIARALLKKPKILILDDSTSAVDTITDSKIRAAFVKDIPDTTKIIIAQRIFSVQEADRILVLDDGKVNGFDTHENLLKDNKIYQEIYESQKNGAGDFDHAAGHEEGEA